MLPTWAIQADSVSCRTFVSGFSLTKGDPSGQLHSAGLSSGSRTVLAQWFARRDSSRTQVLGDDDHPASSLAVR
jgi:hypothetical protein